MRVTAGHARPRLVGLLCMVALLLGLVLSAPNAVYAQDEGGAPAPKAAGEKEKHDQSLIKHIIVSAGPLFGGLLFIISIALVTVVVLLFMDLRMGSAIPPYFVEEFTDTVNKRRFKEAFELSRNESSYIG